MFNYGLRFWNITFYLTHNLIKEASSRYLINPAAGTQSGTQQVRNHTYRYQVVYEYTKRNYILNSP